MVKPAQPAKLQANTINKQINKAVNFFTLNSNLVNFLCPMFRAYLIIDYYNINYNKKQEI